MDEPASVPAPQRRLTDRKRWGGPWRDAIYLAPIATMAAVQVHQDPESQIVFYVASVCAIFLFAIWMLKHIFLPNSDLAATWRRSHDSPIGAAIAFGALCYLVAQLYSASLSLFH